jgi:hypothetical protein
VLLTATLNPRLAESLRLLADVRGHDGQLVNAEHEMRCGHPLS